jgi:hypothetical protein
VTKEKGPGVNGALTTTERVDTAKHNGADLSPGDTAKGWLQRALLGRLDVHEREGTLPTSARFLYYELVQAGIAAKPKPLGAKGRRSDQNLIDALTRLRELGIVPWDWIEDETRALDEFETAPSVAEYVANTVEYALIDRWDGEPAPLILCESRSLAGVLRVTAMRYACPIASTNGQYRGFLISKVAPTLLAKQRVLCPGDFDWCGRQIEENTRRTLIEHSGAVGMLWERVAPTAEQVAEFDLPVISKPDRRYRPVRYFDAVETEALGQARIVALLRARLDELMPEPIDDVLERQRQQRAEVAERLRQIGGLS